MVPHVIPQLIIRKQHHMVSPCDSTINHKKTISHGAHDISQCIMESYIQLTPLNNYLSNCVIKLHMKLLTPNLPLSNCVIKLHTELHSHRRKADQFNFVVVDTTHPCGWEREKERRRVTDHFFGKWELINRETACSFSSPMRKNPSFFYCSKNSRAPPQKPQQLGPST